MSYKFKKFALLGAIILVLSLLVCVLIWSSFNNDVASAYSYTNAYDDTSTTELLFPFYALNTYCETSGISAFYRGSNSSTTLLTYNDYSIRMPVSSDTQILSITPELFTIANNTFTFMNLTSIPENNYSLSYLCKLIIPCSLKSGNTYSLNIMVQHNAWGSYATKSQQFEIGSDESTTEVISTDKFNTFTTSIPNIDDIYCLSYEFTPTFDISYLYFYNTYLQAYFWFSITDSVSFVSASSNSIDGQVSDITATTDYVIDIDYNSKDYSILRTLFTTSFYENGGALLRPYLELTIDGSLWTFYNNSDIQVSHYGGGTLILAYMFQLEDPTGTYSLSFNITNTGQDLSGNYYLEINSRNTFEFTSVTYSLVYGVIGNSDYDIGYNQGLLEGQKQNNNSYNSGYNSGYSSGYQEGLDTAANGSFIGLMSAVIESPLNAVLSIFDVEILGYNMKSLYMSLLSIALILFVIKFILGHIGGSSD